MHQTERKGKPMGGVKSASKARQRSCRVRGECHSLPGVEGCKSAEQEPPSRLERQMEQGGEAYTSLPGF